MKHTPGPWLIEQPENYHAKSHVMSGHYACRVGTWTEAAGVADHGPANLRLIAAAPELLGALREIECWLAGGDVSPRAQKSALHIAQAAIAKADGKR